jgi:hypothetical protein
MQRVPVRRKKDMITERYRCREGIIEDKDEVKEKFRATLHPPARTRTNMPRRKFLVLKL